MARMERFVVSAFALGVLASLMGGGFLTVGAAQAKAGKAAAISLGDYHTCTITTGGGLKCWGNNIDGELGDGTRTPHYAPADVKGLTKNVAAFAGGLFHGCALTSVGAMKCWGKNNYGQLGDGTKSLRTKPTAVSGLGSGVAAISVADSYSCALLTSGGVECWGYNKYGQLGDGTKANRSVPAFVNGLQSGIKTVAAGGHHACALTKKGAVKCWGDNKYGQLGDGTTTPSSTPVPVNGLAARAVALSLGYQHSCALLKSGGVECWGYNKSGQLGDGTKSDHRATPAFVSGLESGVSLVTAGLYHTCILTSEGIAKCWGTNFDGELGDGTKKDRTTPVAVKGLTDGIRGLDAGGYHTCAVTPSSGLKCWGYNQFGELGTGVRGGSQKKPVEVVGF